MVTGQTSLLVFCHFRFFLPASIGNITNLSIIIILTIRSFSHVIEGNTGESHNRATYGIFWLKQSRNVRVAPKQHQTLKEQYEALLGDPNYILNRTRPSIFNGKSRAIYGWTDGGSINRWISHSSICFTGISWFQNFWNMHQPNQTES